MPILQAVVKAFKHLLFEYLVRKRIGPKSTLNKYFLHINLLVYQLGESGIHLYVTLDR